jgi:hypothetical protein
MLLRLSTLIALLQTFQKLLPLGIAYKSRVRYIRQSVAVSGPFEMAGHMLCALKIINVQPSGDPDNYN